MAGRTSVPYARKTTYEQNMADPTVTRRVLQVEHTKIVSAKKFADVATALEASIPKLDDAIAEALAKGDERRATELEKAHGFLSS
jgi:hypothetical protein